MKDARWPTVPKVSRTNVMNKVGVNNITSVKNYHKGLEVVCDV